MVLKNYSWLSLAALALIVGCASQSQSQQRSPEAQPIRKEVSQAKKQPSNSTGEKAPLPIYEITWRFCGPRKDVLGSDQHGCVSSKSSKIYVWGGKKLGDPYTPKGVLLKRGIRNIVGTIKYQVLIWSNGCFGQKQDFTVPEVEGYYSGDVLIPLRQDFAADRKLIEIEVTARHLTPEELTEVITDATIRLHSRGGIALPGGGKTCELVTDF